MAQAWAFLLLPVLFFGSYVTNLFLPTYISSPLCSGSGGRSFLCAQAPKDKDPSPASTMYKTSFHFQPAKNWMNGMLISSLFFIYFKLPLFFSFHFKLWAIR
jgi:hypothetical protein